jgi:hypothetical protein
MTTPKTPADAPRNGADIPAILQPQPVPEPAPTPLQQSRAALMALVQEFLKRNQMSVSAPVIRFNLDTNDIHMCALTQLLIEKKIITEEEVDAKQLEFTQNLIGVITETLRSQPTIERAPPSFHLPPLSNRKS